MNRDLSDDLWRIKVTDNDSFRFEAFQLDQKSYSENELLELYKLSESCLNDTIDEDQSW